MTEAFSTNADPASGGSTLEKDSLENRQVPYVDLQQQYKDEEKEVLPLIREALATGHWVGGRAVEEFEQEIAAYTGTSDAVALGSGTDALILALRVLNIGAGDEVITAPNSFISTASAIVQVGATPIFADVLEDQNIDPNAVKNAITNRTKAILPVHLTGRVADMLRLKEIAAAHQLYLVEDAAQAIGSRRDGEMAGAIGDLGCFSAHPLKNLNASGDAGFITTSNPELAQRLRRMRNNGLADRSTALEWGVVTRLDSIQAALLNYRLKRLPQVIEQRRKNANLYRELLSSDKLLSYVKPPLCQPNELNTYHTFVVQCSQRDALKDFLSDSGVGTSIHYPKPIHLQPAASALGHGPGEFPIAEAQCSRILSLPIHQFLSEADIRYVVRAITRFYERMGRGTTETFSSPSTAARYTSGSQQEHAVSRSCTSRPIS